MEGTIKGYKASPRKAVGSMKSRRARANAILITINAKGFAYLYEGMLLRMLTKSTKENVARCGALRNASQGYARPSARN